MTAIYLPISSVDEMHYATISAEKILNCHTMLNGDVNLQMCKNRIHKHLSQSGIIFLENGERQVLDPDFEQLVNGFWTPLVMQCMSSIIAVGFVPIVLLKTKTGHTVPTVPHPGTYEITIKPVRGCPIEYVYNDVRDLRSNEGKSYVSATVYTGFDHDPLVSGTITSYVQLLADSNLFIKQMSQNALDAEINSTHPPLIMERSNYHPTEYTESPDEHVFNSVADNDADNPQSYRRDASLAVENANELESGNSRIPAMTRKEHKLPERMKLAQYTRPQARSDFVEIKKTLQEAVCAVMGVPLAMFISQTYRGDVESLDETFQTTVRWWQMKLEYLLTKTYADIYSIEFQKAYVLAKIKEAGKALSERELKRLTDEASQNTKKINVAFPFVVEGTSDQLHHAYHRGLVGWETYGRLALTRLGIPSSELNEKDPWTEEERKSILLTSLKVNTEPTDNKRDRSDAKKKNGDRKGEEKKHKTGESKEVRKSKGRSHETDSDSDSSDGGDTRSNSKMPRGEKKTSRKTRDKGERESDERDRKKSKRDRR
jgi:hypothetical protein